MSDVAYLAALVLAVVFGWAGIAKLGARDRTRTTFRALGLPAADRSAVAVPAVELALAAGLVLWPGWTAAAALALLAGFSVFLRRAIRAGVDVGCGCFGAADDRPVSPVALLRNALLGLAALLALTASGPRVPDPVALLVTGLGVTAAGALLALAERRR